MGGHKPSKAEGFESSETDQGFRWRYKRERRRGGGAGSLTAVATKLGPDFVGAHHITITTFAFFATVGDAVSTGAQAFLPDVVRCLSASSPLGLPPFGVPQIVRCSLLWPGLQCVPHFPGR